MSEIPADLRALSEEATPGPWETWRMPDPGVGRHQMTGIAEVGNEMGHRAEAMFPDDAEFIVAAVNFVREQLGEAPATPALRLTCSCRGGPHGGYTCPGCAPSPVDHHQPAARATEEER